MTNRVISLPEDLNQKLKKEENASGLIAGLLDKYYTSLEVKKQIIDPLALQEKLKEIEASAEYDKAKISIQLEELQNAAEATIVMERQMKDKEAWLQKYNAKFDEVKKEPDYMEKFREGLKAGTWRDYVGYIEYRLKND